MRSTSARRTRAWPAPKRRFAMHMAWHDLLFAHWPVEPSPIAALLPPGLELDTFDGRAWLGIVPFRMTGVRPRIMPLPCVFSAFPELNVRTYVVAEGKPGVWFFSLDAANAAAVRVARRFFHLPYRTARITCRTGAEGWIGYRSRRCERRYPPADFVARYRPVQRADGAIGEFGLDPLSIWLTARFCLYASDGLGRLYRCEIDHTPWPLEPAEAIIERNTMTAGLGIALPDGQPLLHFSRRLETVAWTPDRLS